MRTAKLWAEIALEAFSEPTQTNERIALAFALVIVLLVLVAQCNGG